MNIISYNLTIFISLLFTSLAMMIHLFLKKYRLQQVPQKFNHLSLWLPYQMKDGITYHPGEYLSLWLSLQGAPSMDDMLHNFEYTLNDLSKSGVQVNIWSFRNCKMFKLTEGTSISEKIDNAWLNYLKADWHNDYMMLLSIKDTPKRSEKSIKALRDVASVMMQRLHPLKPEVLCQTQSIAIWQHLTGQKNGFKNPLLLNQSLGYPINFNKKQGLARSHHQRYGLVLTGFDERLQPTFFEKFQELPFVMDVQINLIPYDGIKASIKLKQDGRQAALNLGGNQARKHYDAAIATVEEGASLFDFEMLFWLESRDGIEPIVRLARESGIQITPMSNEVRALWQTRLPEFLGIYHFKLLSSQLKYMLSFIKHSYQHNNNPWGNGPIRYIRHAGSHSLYPFQWHQSEQGEPLGHSMIIAPSGGGKSTMMSHLIAGAMRYGINAYLFDMDRGLQVFTEMMGGRYHEIGCLKLNPWVSDLTELEKHTLLNLMTGVNDDTLLDIIRLMQSLQPNDRILKNVMNEAVPRESEIYQKLLPWTEGLFKGLLDGEHQGRAYHELSCGGLQSFDMTELLSNSAHTSILYLIATHLLHQTNNKGQLIFIDEASSYMQSQDFSDQLMLWSKRLRKLNATLHLAFQSPSQILSHPLGMSIKGQMATEIYLVNTKGRRDDYSALGLLEEECDFIMGVHPLSKDPHVALVKNQAHSVYLDMNLVGLGPLLKVYSSGVNARKNLIKAKSHSNWRQRYLEGEA